MEQGGVTSVICAVLIEQASQKKQKRTRFALSLHSKLL